MITIEIPMWITIIIGIWLGLEVINFGLKFWAAILKRQIQKDLKKYGYRKNGK